MLVVWLITVRGGLDVLVAPLHFIVSSLKNKQCGHKIQNTRENARAGGRR